MADNGSCTDVQSAFGMRDDIDLFPAGLCADGFNARTKLGGAALDGRGGLMLAVENLRTVAFQRGRYASPIGRKFEIADFEKYPFMMPSYGEDVEVNEAFAQYQVCPKLLPASADDPVILGMVAGGMGVTMLSELVLRGSSEPVRKVPLLPTIVRPLGIVYRDMHVLSAAERSFLQFVKTENVQL